MTQGKSHSTNNNGFQQDISDGVFLSSFQSLSLFNLATQQGMYDEYRNMEGANDDLDYALKGKPKPKKEVKSRKIFLAAYCNLVWFETEDLFSEMPEVKELRNRSRDSLHAIEDMISKATTNEMEREREEKNRLKAEKQESDPSLKAKQTILCKDSITQKEKKCYVLVLGYRREENC